MHKHHLIPKHRGGSDDSSNIIEVSLNQHIMFHFCEWKRLGLHQDLCAYKMLAGSHAGGWNKGAKMKPCSNETREKLRQINLGKQHSEESKKKMSESAKKRGPSFIGKKHSEESKKKMSESAKKRGCNSKPWLGKKQPDDMIEKRCNKIRRKILITFPDGTQEIVIGGKEASNKTGIKLSTIRSNLRKNQINKAGYKFEYMD